MKASYRIIREIESHFSEMKKEVVYESRRRRDVERFIYNLGKLHSSRGEKVIRVNGGIGLPNYSSIYYIVKF